MVLVILVTSRLRLLGKKFNAASSLPCNSTPLNKAFVQEMQSTRAIWQTYIFFKIIFDALVLERLTFSHMFDYTPQFFST